MKMKVKFLADYDLGQNDDSNQSGDRRVDARILVEDVGGKLIGVIVTYGKVDSVQFIAVLPNSDAALKIAVAILSAGGSLAEVTVLEPSHTMAAMTRSIGNKFERRVAKKVGIETSPYPLSAM